MTTPIDPRTLSPHQHAVLFETARRDADVLRRAAIAEAFATAWRRVTRGHRPQTEGGAWPPAALGR